MKKSIHKAIEKFKNNRGLLHIQQVEHKNYEVLKSNFVFKAIHSKEGFDLFLRDGDALFYKTVQEKDLVKQVDTWLGEKQNLLIV